MLIFPLCLDEKPYERFVV